MGTPRSKEECRKFIDEASAFLKEYEFLLTPSLTKFFEESSFSNIPLEWKELLQESEETLIRMASLREYKGHWNASLKAFIERSSQFVLQSEMDDSLYDPLENSITIGMEPSKRLQVRGLAGFINEFARDQAITSAVDIGAGQGYLDQCLAYQYGLTVIAVDDSTVQTKGAQKHAHLIERSLKYRNLPKRLFHLEERINIGDNLKDIIARLLSDDVQIQDSSWLLCGLHTCGDLAVSCIQEFLSSDCKGLVNVGCCYNHLTEADSKHSTFHHDDENGPRDIGYPLSKHLKQKQLFLGYGTRMLAAQTTFKWHLDVQHSIQHIKERAWRAILQVLILSHYPGQVDPTFIPVGRLPSRAKKSFLIYVKSALKKLNLEYPSDSLNDEVVIEIENQYKFRIKELAVFWTLKALLAETVESLILVDRMMYLHESNLCQSIELRAVFSRNASPRNMAIVAIKSDHKSC